MIQYLCANFSNAEIVDLNVPMFVVGAINRSCSAPLPSFCLIVILAKCDDLILDIRIETIDATGIWIIVNAFNA